MTKRFNVFIKIALACVCLLCLPAAAFALDTSEAHLQAGTMQTGTAQTDSAQAKAPQATAVQVETQSAIHPPAKPVVTSAYSNAAGRIMVNVRLQGGASGFQYVVSKSSKFKSIAQTAWTTATAYQFSNLNSGKKYYVKVRAYWQRNGQIVFGKWSKRKTVKPKKLVLGVVGSTSGGAGGWMARNGCTVKRIKSANVNPYNYDGLIIPGGGDVDPALYGQKKNPHDFGISRKLDLLQIAVIKKFAYAGKPVLGICRGAQVINVAFGGTLYQHIKGWHRGSRTAVIQSGTWLYPMFGSTEKVSHYHHQCALRLGDGLVATQWDAKDHHIEAIEHVSLPVYGLQWHPEGMGKRGSKVAKAFMQICMYHSKQR